MAVAIATDVVVVVLREVVSVVDTAIEVLVVKDVEVDTEVLV